jgi:hypothetical protein
MISLRNILHIHIPPIPETIETRNVYIILISRFVWVGILLLQRRFRKGKIYNIYYKSPVSVMHTGREPTPTIPLRTTSIVMKINVHGGLASGGVVRGILYLSFPL